MQKMRFTKYSAVGAIAVAIAVLVPAARADTITTFTLGTGPSGCPASGCGTVTLTQGTNSVLVSVSLVTPTTTGVFVETGNHLDFGFNVLGAITINGLSTGFTADPGNPSSGALPGTFSQSGLGTYIFTIDCNLGATPACTNGSSTSTTSSFSFTVNQTGLTNASFIANAAGDFFTADLFNGNTAPVGSGPGTTVTTPEPGTFALLGLGVVGLLGLRRKRSLA